MRKPAVETKEDPKIYIAAKVKSYLVEWLDELGEKEGRSRSNMLERILEERFLRDAADEVNDNFSPPGCQITPT